MDDATAIYARISEDELGTQHGVTRQLEDGRELCRVRGYRVVAEYADNDISATNGDHRPEYERLMALVDSRQIKRIVVFHTSRLWRNRRERAEGIERCRAAGVSIVPVKGSELDLSSASGRMLAGILGEFDTAESEIKGERVARAALQRAREGRANGAVAYGWRRVYMHDDQRRVTGFRDEVNPAEAKIVREIVRRLLRGDTLRAIADDLNARGIPAPGAGRQRKRRGLRQAEDGRLWLPSSVRKIATRPANIGLRVYHRGRPDEQLLPASWPAIVDRGQHDRVVALLNDPARVHTVPASRLHLLTYGIGECGVCGGPLRVAVRGNSKYGRKAQLYVCEVGDCVGRNVERVDEFVRLFVIEFFQRPDVADLLFGSDDDAARQAEERVEGLRARLDQAADDFAAGLIDREQLHRITARLRPQLEEAAAEAKALRPHPQFDLAERMIGRRAEYVWDHELGVNGRRAVLDVLGVAVRIMPVTRRGPGFDPNSVSIEDRRKALAQPVPARNVRNL